MKKLTKSELVEKISSSIEGKVTKAEVEKFLDHTQEIIAKELGQGNSVCLPMLGTFKISNRKARVGINPRTGAKVNISAKTACTFKSSKNLKDKLNK